MPAFFYYTQVMHHPVTLLITILALFLLNTSISRADSHFSLSANLLYFDYEEYDDAGLSLNHEFGFIPGIGFHLTGSNNMFSFQLFDGNVEYDGQTQAGTPHQTTTDETVYRLNYRHTFSPDFSSVKTNYFLGINYQIWDRSILPNNGVSGLFEQYRWWSAEAGFISTLSQYNNDTVTLELGLSYSFNGTILVDLTPFGSGEPVLDLGNRPGARVALVYQKMLSTNQALTFTLEHRHWEFGKSNLHTITTGAWAGSTILEPESRSDHSLFSVSLSSYF